MIELLLIILLALMVLSLLAMGFIAYMLWRNNLVRDYRTAILEDRSVDISERLRRHSTLPEYNKMLWQIFTFKWDVK